MEACVAEKKQSKVQEKLNETADKLALLLDNAITLQNRLALVSIVPEEGKTPKAVTDEVGSPMLTQLCIHIDKIEDIKEIIINATNQLEI